MVEDGHLAMQWCQWQGVRRIEVFVFSEVALFLMENWSIVRLDGKILFFFLKRVPNSRYCERMCNARFSDS